jgi:pyocin large subunit-like protein
LAIVIVLLTLVGCADLVANLESTEVMASEAVRSTDATPIAVVEEEETYVFRSQDLFNQHYNKHGQEFGDISQEEYLRLANALFHSQEALRKTEADGDGLFYDPESNTFGVLSQDGYIRTCFKPDDGVDYWNRQ